MVSRELEVLHSRKRQRSNWDSSCSQGIFLRDSVYITDSDTSSNSASLHNLPAASVEQQNVFGGRKKVSKQNSKMPTTDYLQGNSEVGLRSSERKNTSITRALHVPSRRRQTKIVTTEESPEVICLDDCMTDCVKRSSEAKRSLVVGVEKKTKKNCCYYCRKVVTKIGRHLVNHTSEKEIMNINSKTDKKEKDYLLKELRLLGNYRFNLECIEKGSGNLIVMRAPTYKCDASKFLPCPYCFGFLYKKELHKHCKQCPYKPEHLRVLNPTSEAQLLLMSHVRSPGTDDMDKLVLMKLRDGEVKNKIKNDPLILAFAESQIKRLRAANVEKFDFLCHRLRILGRLLLECEKTMGYSMSLNDLIKPGNFDLFIRSVQNMSENENKPKSVGFKIGHAIRKCCYVAKCIAIKSGDELRRIEVNSFLTLMDGEWNDLVNSPLRRELYDQKLSKETILSVTTDLMKLNNYVSEELGKSLQDMLSSPCKENYFKLARAALCKIVLFNKRRGGEVAQITVKNFVRRPNWSSPKTEDMCKNFTKLEKKLAERLDMIKVVGKKGLHVPILLTLDVVEAMNLLVKVRHYVAIKNCNPYFFANTGDKYLRANEVLHTFVQSADLSTPSAITSTNLWKYIATVSQVISLEKEELEWIADLLGHSTEVHQEFYRVQESTLETCKVSKLLMALESGSLHELVGKKLSDIKLEDCFIEEIETGNIKSVEEDCFPEEVKAENIEGVEEDCLPGEVKVENIAGVEEDYFPEEVEAANIKCVQEDCFPEGVEAENITGQQEDYFSEGVQTEGYSIETYQQYNSASNILQLQPDISEPGGGGGVYEFSAFDRIGEHFLNVVPKNELVHPKMTNQCQNNKDLKAVGVTGKKKWDPMVKSMAFKYFRDALDSRRAPGKYECENFMKTYDIKNRMWKDVKNLIYNEIKKTLA